MPRYTKPSAELVRKVTNGFGTMPATKMIEIRQRAMKIIMMDYATWCLKEAKMSVTDTKKAVHTAIERSIEMDVSTPKLKETIDKFIDRKAVVVDPLMKLHCAVTMETLESVSKDGTPNSDDLPQEVQDASECGANCFGGDAPVMSMEALMMRPTDGQVNLYRAVGGSITDQMFHLLGNTLDPKYVTNR